MARVAGDLPHACEALVVDREHHAHHVPGNLLRLLVVLVKVLGYVTIAAFHTERGTDKPHRRDQFVRRNIFEYLDVLIPSFRILGFDPFGAFRTVLPVLVSIDDQAHFCGKIGRPLSLSLLFIKSDQRLDRGQMKGVQYNSAL